MSYEDSPASTSTSCKYESMEVESKLSIYRNIFIMFFHQLILIINFT